MKKHWIAVLLILALVAGACTYRVAPLPQQPSPLPQGEGQGEGVAPSPTSEEEGQGEIAEPSPTSEGEGQGEGDTPSPLPEGESQGAAAPLVPVHGVELHRLDNEGGLDVVKANGAYWLRRNALQWPQIEPQEGARNWSTAAGLEAELVTASQQGMQVILVVRGAPDWAQAIPGVACGPVAAEKLPAFARFLHDAVARYSAPPYNVKYWELMNEPDVAAGMVPSDSVFGCWGDPNDPVYGGAYYAEMLKLAYPQVKAADSQAQVLTGGLLLDCDPDHPPQGKDCTPALFLEGILQNGGGDFFDGVSYHAYDSYMGVVGAFANPNWNTASNSGGVSLIAKARYLRGLLEGYGFPGKFLVNTEVGLICGRDGTEAPCLEPIFEETKAYFAAQAYAAAQAEGLLGNIWYNYFGWRGTGLVTREGQPRPVLRAFNASAQMLNGAAFLGEITQYPGLHGYRFQRGGQELWLIWSLDGGEHPLSLEREASAVFDVYGAPLSPAAEMMIGIAPVYIAF